MLEASVYLRQFADFLMAALKLFWYVAQYAFPFYFLGLRAHSQ